MSIAIASADLAAASWRSSRRDLMAKGMATATAPASTRVHWNGVAGAPSRRVETT